MVKAEEVMVGNRFIMELYSSRGLEYDHDFVLTEENMGLLFSDIRLSLQDLFGIPLSPDILVKCGFVKISNDNFGYPQLKINGYYSIKTNSDGGNSKYLFLDGLRVPCEYLHQLQNLYYSLTGESLTVNI